MFCKNEVPMLSTGNTKQCDSCDGITLAGFPICSVCSALKGQCEVCRGPVDTQLNAHQRQLVESARESFKAITATATDIFEPGSERDKIIRNALARRDGLVRQVLLDAKPAPDGPELPPTIRSHPKQGREALFLLDLALAALVQFERTVRYGLFSVQFTNDERAKDLAKHAHRLAQAGKNTPDTELWVSFRTFGEREHITLPQFFEQKRRGKWFFRGVLKNCKKNIESMREICIRQLSAAVEDERQEILRLVVSELEPSQ